MKNREKFMLNKSLDVKYDKDDASQKFEIIHEKVSNGYKRHEKHWLSYANDKKA